MGDGDWGRGLDESLEDDVSSAMLEGHMLLARQYAPSLTQLVETGIASSKQSTWIKLTVLDALLVDTLGTTVFDALFMRHTHIAFPGLNQAIMPAKKPSQLLFFFSNRYLPGHVPGVIAAVEPHGGGVRCTISLLNRRAGGIALLRSLSCALLSLLGEACQESPDVEVHYGAESLTLTAVLPEQFDVEAKTSPPASIEPAREEAVRLPRTSQADLLPTDSHKPARRDESRDVPDRTARLNAAAVRWKLTARQSQVLAHLLAGRSNKEIAVALHCSVATTATHVLTILRKTNTHSRQELVAYFWGDVP